MNETTSPLDPVTAPELSRMSSVAHAYFTRPGGVSKGLYEGLNTGVGSKDKQEHVTENRALAARHLSADPANLVTVYQVHSADAVIVDEPIAGERPKADAMATAKPGLMLGVQTADCGPVLFADETAGVIGAAHAGWKGATGGVLEAALDAMEQLGAKRPDITAVLGPTISAENYEVGPEFIDRLLTIQPDNDRWISASIKPGHGMFDLPGYIVDRLNQQGVTARWTGQCTYADDTNFFSYRRTTHRAEPDYGRQLSAIYLKP